jgi:hypothetical protein
MQCQYITSNLSQVFDQVIKCGRYTLLKRGRLPSEHVNHVIGIRPSCGDPSKAIVHTCTYCLLYLQKNLTAL